MNRVLVADDETNYGYYIGEALGRAGFAVKVATNGRDAIELGTCFKPHVLIADWMLNNHIHGLQVSEALRMANGELETILITGFPSKHLIKQALEHGVFKFLTKPVDLNIMKDLVVQALEKSSGGSSPKRKLSTVGVLEATEQGEIIYTNAEAQALLEKTVCGNAAKKLSDIFTNETVAQLEKSKADWRTVFPIASSAVSWRVYFKSLEGNGNCVLFLLDDEKKYLLEDYAVKQLVETTRRWSTPGAMRHECLLLTMKRYSVRWFLLSLNG